MNTTKQIEVRMWFGTGPVSCCCSVQTTRILNGPGPPVDAWAWAHRLLCSFPPGLKQGHKALHFPTRSARRPEAEREGQDVPPAHLLFTRSSIGGPAFGKGE